MSPLSPIRPLHWLIHSSYSTSFRVQGFRLGGTLVFIKSFIPTFSTSSWSAVIGLVVNNGCHASSSIPPEIGPVGTIQSSENALLKDRSGRPHWVQWQTMSSGCHLQPRWALDIGAGYQGPKVLKYSVIQMSMKQQIGNIHTVWFLVWNMMK